MSVKQTHTHTHTRYKRSQAKATVTAKKNKVKRHTHTHGRAQTHTQSNTNVVSERWQRIRIYEDDDDSVARAQYIPIYYCRYIACDQESHRRAYTCVSNICPVFIFFISSFHFWIIYLFLIYLANERALALAPWYYLFISVYLFIYHWMQTRLR